MITMLLCHCFSQTLSRKIRMIDNSMPASPSLEEAPFPIVGIGASAGGLAAFEGFFSGMPAHTAPHMAFVLVQHLAPDHKSILVDLVRRYTPMQVFEVEDGMVAQPNCVYIIPPNRDMAFQNGALHLLEPAMPRGQRLPIDFFFRSLAQDQHERAIGIILSGTGSDGSLGVRAIKAEGGLVMVQKPESAEYDGMPRSAIGTGLADYELSPAEMPAQLSAYATRALGKPPRPSTAVAPKNGTALNIVFILLRAKTGHDFSLYKPSTIHRRIDRRMAINQIETIGRYVKFLQQTPSEVEALFHDLLIGVTNFFRDPEAFKTLEEKALPALFSSKPPGSLIRVWTPGCSTGEESYSLAILLQERLEALKQTYKVQVFATDIDPAAIATARAGLYPASIAADVSPERLARYFTLEPDGAAYRIHKNIRDFLVFSEQDVIKDPPFPKLDLISCRNLMIYMSGDLQKKLIPLFHYALAPNGMLFLGTSETVGDSDDLFSTLDRKARLYQRKADFPGSPRAIFGRHIPPGPRGGGARHPVPGSNAAPGKQSLREMTEEALLQQLAPTGALVNSQGDILYLHGRTGIYLEPSPGEAGTSNILKMAREGLRRDLANALRKAAETNESVRCPALRIKTNGHFTIAVLTVRPLTSKTAATPDFPLYLVMLQEEPAESAAPRKGKGRNREVAGAPLPAFGDTADASIEALQQELRTKEEFIQSVNQELETSNKELKSSNEEMQSVNEEVQSTNEELETSKEEMQSINEELSTINAELQSKLTELSRSRACRQNQIEEVVTALLTNAMEAFEEGARDEGRLDGGAHTIRLSARPFDNKGCARLRLAVEDNGPGIPEAIREHVFNPFFTTKDRTRHAGLGLWISQSIVHEHGGELTFESNIGKGTRVHVDLPVTDSV